MHAQKQISLLEGPNVRHIERNGEFWFTAEEIGKHLGYSDPKDDVNRLYNKNKKELEPYSTTTKLVAVDGKHRDTRVYSEEGVYILTILARTDKARKFRAKVARLIRELRQQRLELARQVGQNEALEIMTSLTPLQLKLFDRIVTYYRKGLNGAEIAKLLDVSKDTVNTALRRIRQAGVEVR